MKLSFYSLLFAALFLLRGETVQAKISNPNYDCKDPYWNAPAESQSGIFNGDLSLDCSILGETPPHFDLLNLRKKIIDKIRSESIIHDEPSPSLFLTTAPLTWDISHRFEEEGNSIQIRETLTLSIEKGNQLKYQTHSEEILASGMAGYLRSIEFGMTISQINKHLNVSFRNRVQVKRPWYALDLIFAPIARGICYKKLNQVKDKFMPWIIQTFVQ